MQSPFRNINNLMPLIRGRLPGQLIIQYSNRCNADCPQCGMRRSEQISRYTLDKDHAKKLIDSAAANGVRSLSLTGGEPLIFLDDIVELTNHAGRAGIPYVRTGTNGFIFRNSDAPDFRDKISPIVEKLASTSLYTFWISMDSANPANHERMRGLDGVVKGIEKALPIFHEHGIYPAVNLGINRVTGGCREQPFLSTMDREAFLQTFKESFEAFYRFAVDLGFTMANACYPMSDGADPEQEDRHGTTDLTYGAISSDAVINFSREEKSIIFQQEYRRLFAILKSFDLQIYLTMDVLSFTPMLKSLIGGSISKGIQFIKRQLHTVFSTFEEVDGIIFQIGECDGNDVKGDFRSELFLRNTSAVNRLIRELLPLFEQHDRTMILRTWTIGAYRIGDFIWHHDTTARVLKQVDSPHFILSMKYGESDFFRYLPLNKHFFKFNVRKIIELQARREYEGCGE